MESRPQNPEFRINPENFHPCIIRISRYFYQRVEDHHDQAKAQIFSSFR